MWIALGIVGFLAALITVILILPVKVIIKSDGNDELYLRYKFLGKTYGEDPDPNDPIILMLKKAGGVIGAKIVKNGGLAPLELTVDPAKLPARFKKVKIEADSAAIREALENGEKLKYAYLGERGEHIKIG